MKKTIYVTGSAGLVASRFLELSKEKYVFLTPEIDEIDITNKKTVDAFFRTHNFDLVINFAAFTNVSEAEKQRGDKKGSCWQVNVEGVRNLALACKDKGISLIQISTDMVFSGSEDDKGPYGEEKLPEDNLDKVTWYGYSKGWGEKVAKEVLKDKSVIVRIIYPVRAHFEGKPDYLRSPLKLFDEGKLYPMFNNQQISNTFIDELALALESIIDNNLNGTFHVSSSTVTTPYEFISYMLEKVRGVMNAVKGQTVEEFTQKTKAPPFRYPKYGGLKVEETQKRLGLKFSPSKGLVDKLIKQGLGR